MSIPRIGIIVSSIRDGRFADSALDWLVPIANQRRDLEFEILDLKDYPLPLFYEATPRAPASRPMIRSPASGAPNSTNWTGLSFSSPSITAARPQP